MRAVIFILICHSLTARANSENDRREAYGNGGNNDGAAYVGDEKTKQQLTPPMMGHYSKAATYFAMGNIPLGTIEQNKGDMLKEQIRVNKDSADKNRKSEKLVNEYGDEAENRDQPQGTRVITVDEERRDPAPSSDRSPPQNVPIDTFDRVRSGVPSQSSLSIGDQLAPLRDLSSGAVSESTSGGASATAESTATGETASRQSEAQTTESAAQRGAAAESALGVAAVGEQAAGSFQGLTSILLAPRTAVTGSKSALDDKFFSVSNAKKEDERRNSRRRGKTRYVGESLNR